MKLLILLTCILASCMAMAKEIKYSGVPVSINHIEVHRVGNHLIRIIKHNMELEPKVELEFILPPEMQIKDYLSITSAKTPEREYSFKTSDGVFVENIEINKKLWRSHLNTIYQRQKRLP